MIQIPRPRNTTYCKIVIRAFFMRHKDTILRERKQGGREGLTYWYEILVFREVASSHAGAQGYTMELAMNCVREVASPNAAAQSQAIGFAMTA